ncbi:hypothetical protein GMSM_46250 [Geomonas sp. Red276]
MARALRIEYEGAFYHVTTRGNERKKIFFTARDYDKFKEYVFQAQQKFHFILHGYVLMTNHYHLLIETPEKNLQRVMHYINSSYSTYTNTKRDRSGHLFQGRYNAIIVDKDSYLLELSKYIHLNPDTGEGDAHAFHAFPLVANVRSGGMVMSCHAKPE